MNGMIGDKSVGLLVLVAALGSSAAAAPAAAVQGQRGTRALVVHLPEAPIESMGKLGEGVTQLASYLAANVPGLPLDVKAFRKRVDARDFIASQEDGVALVACDAAFVLDLPPGYEVIYRFARAGRETRRKLVVVRADSGLRTLADLRGRSLTVALGESSELQSYLSRAIFGGEIDAGSWFSGITYETDDFTATAAVLYGRTDAALVSDDNPLAATNLAKDLLEIYASDPVSMSVIAVRTTALDASQRQSLETVLGRFGDAAETEPIREALLFDGFRRVSGELIVADLRGASAGGRELEVALPALGPMTLEELPPVGPDEIPFVVGIELMEVEIPSTLVDSVLKEKAQ